MYVKMWHIISKGISAIASGSGKPFLALLLACFYLLRVNARKKSLQNFMKEPAHTRIHEHSTSAIANSDWGFFCDMQETTPPTNVWMNMQADHSRTQNSQSTQQRKQPEVLPAHDASCYGQEGDVLAEAGISKAKVLVYVSKAANCGSHNDDSTADESLLWDEFQGDEYINSPTPNGLSSKWRGLLLRMLTILRRRKK